MKLDSYPNIKKWVTEVALCNGMINRLEPEELTYQKAEQALFADGVPEQDVVLLETWLGSLSPEDFDTITDGEQLDQLVIITSAPKGIEERPVSKLLDDIFEF